MWAIYILYVIVIIIVIRCSFFVFVYRSSFIVFVCVVSISLVELCQVTSAYKNSSHCLVT